MDKEIESSRDSGHSEKALDKSVDNTKNQNQVKAVNIFDSKKKKNKEKEKIILEN